MSMCSWERFLASDEWEEIRLDWKRQLEEQILAMDPRVLAFVPAAREMAKELRNGEDIADPNVRPFYEHL